MFLNESSLLYLDALKNKKTDLEINSCSQSKRISLNIIDLSFNQLDNLAAYHLLNYQFPGCIEIEILNLSHNLITTFNLDWQIPKTMQNLNLQNNQIQNIVNKTICIF